jgi:hypothetical protein
MQVWQQAQMQAFDYFHHAVDVVPTAFLADHVHVGRHLALDLLILFHGHQFVIRYDDLRHVLLHAGLVANESTMCES